MTTLIERPATASPNCLDEHITVDPQVVTREENGKYPAMEAAQAYFSLGELPIPLCDAAHFHVSAQHRDGYQRKDGTVASPCKSPGKAPLERDFPRFATKAPSAMDIVRMFGSHQGNIGAVVPERRIVIDIDPRSGGLDSVATLTGKYGPFPETPTVRTGGNGLHNYFHLPEEIKVPSGGSLAASGYPGIEWKGAGAQVVLPPSVHTSGQAYRWEPDYALGEVPVAQIPDWLLQLILEQLEDSLHRFAQGGDSGAVRYTVQPTRVQEHFTGLWKKARVEIQPGSGDQFYSCPFHEEEHPSMHVDAMRCIWFCFSPECPGHGGGGIRLLESLVGPLERGPYLAA